MNASTSATESRAQICRQRRRVVGVAEAVIERPEPDTGLLGLALGPFMPIEIQPDPVRRVGDRLDERRSPLRVTDVEVVVVDMRRLTAVFEVRMRVRAPVAPASPDRRLLLRDTDHHDPEPAIGLGARKQRARDVFFDLITPEAHDGHALTGREALDGRLVTADLVP